MDWRGIHRRRDTMSPDVPGECRRGDTSRTAACWRLSRAPRHRARSAWWPPPCRDDRDAGRSPPRRPWDDRHRDSWHASYQGVDGCLEQRTLVDAEAIGEPVGQHFLADGRIVVLA